MSIKKQVTLSSISTNSHSSLQDLEGFVGTSLLQRPLLLHFLPRFPLSCSLCPLLSSVWSRSVVWTKMRGIPRTAALLLLLHQLRAPSRPLLQNPSDPIGCWLRVSWVSPGLDFGSCQSGGTGVWPVLQSAGSALQSGSRDPKAPHHRALWLRIGHPGNEMVGWEGGRQEGRWKRKKRWRRLHRTTGWPAHVRHERKLTVVLKRFLTNMVSQCNWRLPGLIYLS